ncbi:hypothetical protein JCM8115_005594 [Rhodotorula mucilaginosa]
MDTSNTVAACKDTAESFACLTKAVEAFAKIESGGVALPRGLAVFLPFVNLEEPRWPDVQKTLLAHFGKTRNSRREAVEPGEAGIKLVMTVLRRTVITDDFGCVAAVEQWLSWLELAVRDRLAEIADKNAAPAAGQAAALAGAFSPHNDIPSPHVNSALQSRHGTMTTSTPVPANRSASSTPSAEMMHSGPDEKMADDRNGRCRTNSRNADTGADADYTSTISAFDSEPSISSLRRDLSAARERAACRLILRRKDAASGSSGHVGTTARARDSDESVATPPKPPKKAKLLLPAPTSPRIFRKAPSPSTTAALIRHVFPHIDLPSLDKPLDLPDISADKRAFDRKELRTNPQATINRGSVGTTYFRSRRFIALKPELNVCDPGPTALGEPLVVITDDAVCRKFFEAVEYGREPGSGPHPVPINVFIKNATKKWVYRGAYELAYDGSGEQALRLLPGAGATANVHESIRCAVEARIDDGPEIRNNQAMLRSWGWKLPTYSTNRKEASKVDLWTELEVTDLKPRISFLVLRCVGFSVEDYEVWKGLREEVGVYRDPNEER